MTLPNKRKKDKDDYNSTDLWFKLYTTNLCVRKYIK